jgi:hypothetical protein
MARVFSLVLEEEMSVVVAGIFDDQTQATEAMDILLRSQIKDLDTHVIEGQGRYASQQDLPNIVAPFVPNTGNNMGNGNAAYVPGNQLGGWLNDMADVERDFYEEGMREGSTLVLARVHEDDAEKVRQLLRDHQARTYVKD